MPTLPLLPTTVVGSYPQPNWLVDRQKQLDRLPPRIRTRDLWRVAEPWLAEAQDDATLLTIRAMEDAGVDIISDGETRRESYSNVFANALEGIDEQPAEALSRRGLPDLVPPVVGPLRRRGPVQVHEVAFLRAHTGRAIKVTVPGPFTLSMQAVNSYYPDARTAALAYAEVVNAEVKDLFAAGADVVQLDEPYTQARVPQAEAFAVEAVNRALEGVQGTTALHVCFGYGAKMQDKSATTAYAFLEPFKDSAVTQLSIEAAQPPLDLAVLERLGGKAVMLGVLDLGTHQVETPEQVAARIRAALQHIAADRLTIAPDCGMKYLPRAVAFAKLRAMVDGARIVRRELGVG